MTKEELLKEFTALFNDHDPSEMPRMLRGVEYSDYVDVAKRFAKAKLEEVQSEVDRWHDDGQTPEINAAFDQAINDLS